MPWIIPSPKNQCGELPCDGFEPLRTYIPDSSGGIAPRTSSASAWTSSVTGAKLPCNHHGLVGSIAAVFGGAAVVDGAVAVVLIGDVVVLVVVVVVVAGDVVGGDV